jgi:hypothetical protein
MTSVPIAAGLGLMLLWVALQPWLPEWLRRGRAVLALPVPAPAQLGQIGYRKILVPLALAQILIALIVKGVLWT